MAGRTGDASRMASGAAQIKKPKAALIGALSNQLSRKSPAEAAKNRRNLGRTRLDTNSISAGF